MSISGSIVASSITTANSSTASPARTIVRGAQREASAEPLAAVSSIVIDTGSI